MKALIILAHGSRRKQSNEEIEELTIQIKALVKKNFDIVDHAFLEVASPSLTNAIENLISSNASEINIFPYFLNSGVHIKDDIPNIIKKAGKKYPDCKFKLSSHIGAYKKMPEIILKQLNSE
tara:strand:+ start:1113 stop:1478 length:366 start_codon:yes stop_codon:yes gene_type:complete